MNLHDAVGVLARRGLTYIVHERHTFTPELL